MINTRVTTKGLIQERATGSASSTFTIEVPVVNALGVSLEHAGNTVVWVPFMVDVGAGAINDFDWFLTATDRSEIAAAVKSKFKLK